MKYVNSFTISIKGSECFVTLEQVRPQGEDNIKTELKTIVMSEETARHLAAALDDLYNRVDEDRAQSVQTPLKRS